MKKCECGRTICEVSSRCMSCSQKSRWRDGAYTTMIARDRRRRTKSGPYIVDYGTMTAVGWPLMRPALV